ncbi:hypothetical protein F0U44_08390 [Nocardioides humilatus]|uniref:Sulphotransferase Stf0 domain-containing protein n=1 Tax=Nocardioides humilatus TaxID=2607660 RepID=A0A5B1LE95_9ACTN|nr:Stf0 family sulfotransferase [Nocardioides humilatus]KAA1418518.1 hypothetical protein F0U44_08390 [Nocardioides humilatus]
MDALTLVISAPRTGSTLLCRDIASLGGLGSPREYLRGFEGVARSAPTPEAAEAAVLERLAESVQESAPGVGAVKLMVQQARPVAEALTGVRPQSSADAVSSVVTWASGHFDHLCVVVLVRNALDVAISRAVAEATGVYHSTSKAFRADGERPLDDVDINEAIMGELLAACRDRRTLQAVVAAHGDLALTLTYEELTERAGSTTARLLAHARSQGLDPQGDQPRRRLTKVMSAERSDDLRRSFLTHLGSEPGI